MIAAHVGVVATQPERATVFLYDWKYLSSPRREQIAAQRDEYERLFRAVIAEGIAAGAFAPADSKLAATLVLSALNGIPGWFRANGPLSAEDVAEGFADMLLRGLVAREA